MRIRISSIPPDGMRVESKLSLHELNARMNEGRSNDIIFTSEPQLSLRAEKTVGGAEIKGELRTTYKQPCSRCMEQVDKDLHVDFHFNVAPSEDASEDANPEHTQNEDIGIIFYEGDHVELEEVLQEYIILSLSPYWHPECDQSGDCSHCGRKFTQAASQSSQALAPLLKKAGLKLP